MIKKVDHVVITTGQPAPCLAFYKKLGFTALDAGGRYELYAGDFKINVHIKGSELSPYALAVTPGSADLCFELSGSLAAFENDLKATGLTILLGPVTRTGIKGAMRSIYLRDPDGNLLEFCSYDQP